MALTPSAMIRLGSLAPDFRLPDTDGNSVGLDDFPRAKGYLILFICNHCPYVKHIREKLAEVTTAYQKKGIAVVAINSNDAVKYPDDSPANMKLEKQTYHYTFPYLFDETQEVARRYQAACTPDIFLYDSIRSLVYRGQFDDSRPGNNIPVTGKDLCEAMDAVLQEHLPKPNQRPSVGCNIKWKSLE